MVRAEKRSGATREGRAELELLLSFMQRGDTLVVTRIDRLARSLKDLQDIVHDLRQRGIALKATEQPVDTSSAAGKAFLDMLGVFAEFETNMRRERQLEGIARAKANGVYVGKGRRRTVDVEAVRSLHARGVGPAEIARQLRIGRTSVYRALGLGENGSPEPIALGALSLLLRNRLRTAGVESLADLVALDEAGINSIPGLRKTEVERLLGLRARAIAEQEGSTASKGGETESAAAKEPTR